MKEFVTEQLLHECEMAGYPIDKRTVYYMEQLGILNPRKEQRGSVKKRYYSPKDLKRVLLMARYLCRGMTVREAWEICQREKQRKAYFLVKLDAGKSGRFIEAAKQLDDICEAAAVYGGGLKYNRIYDIDVILTAKARHESDLDDLEDNKLKNLGFSLHRLFRLNLWGKQ